MQNQEPITLKGIFYSGDIRQQFIGHIMAEIFKDRVYAPFIEGKKDLTIMDVGAHVGIFSHYAAPYAKQIYAIEPSLEHFTVFNQMITFNNLVDKVTPFNYALSNKNGKENLYHSGNKTAYTLFGDEKQNKDFETVETVTIEKFMNDNDIDHVDFMKLDIEGKEFEVLGGKAFSKISDRIDSLVVELHSWAGRNPNQAVESLRENGYEVGQIPSDAQLLFAKR